MSTRKRKKRELELKRLAGCAIVTEADVRKVKLSRESVLSYLFVCVSEERKSATCFAFCKMQLCRQVEFHSMAIVVPILND